MRTFDKLAAFTTQWWFLAIADAALLANGVRFVLLNEPGWALFQGIGIGALMIAAVGQYRLSGRRVPWWLK